MTVILNFKFKAFFFNPILQNVLIMCLFYTHQQNRATTIVERQIFDLGSWTKKSILIISPLPLPFKKLLRWNLWVWEIDKMKGQSNKVYSLLFFSIYAQNIIMLISTIATLELLWKIWFTTIKDRRSAFWKGNQNALMLYSALRSNDKSSTPFWKL